METPNLVLVFLIFSSVIMLFQWRKTEASMENCRTKCGDIEVPYPFGMDKGCYLDETFRIICNEVTGSATLDWMNWDVDNISIATHTFRHTNFSVLVFPFNESGESFYGHSYVRSVENSYYSISHTRNKLLAMGCDFYVYLIDRETRELQGGCASLCNQTDVVPSPSSACSGLNCCEMSFLSDLTNLSVGIETMNTATKSWIDQCGCFAFVDDDFLSLKKMKPCECNTIYHVPIIHEWAVGNTSCNKARERVDYVCGKNTECFDYNPGKGYRCRCSNGYQGNPYLPEGCQDIDECGNPMYNNCPNNNHCVNTVGSYFCLPDRRNLLALIVPLGTGLAVGLLILVAFGIWMWRKITRIKERKIKQKCFKKNGGLLLKQQISSSAGRVLLELIHFAIEELEKATDKFSESRILGRGGLGTVYKGMLSDGRIVAVKKANIIDDRQVDQFINEVFILSQINHRNIVKLLGCCLETEVPLLVYEYISNGTLSYHLHGEPNSSTFSWEDRLRIAAEVAEALAYLHSYAKTAIIHRDIKSSNILLDENYKAVISDFGLSKSVSIDKTHLTTLVGGTFGYLDPEYFRTGKLNDKSDVYAFGVVLAELLTGQKAVSSTIDDRGLALCFRSALKENCLFEMLENIVAYEGQKEEILAVAKLAKRCLKTNVHKRPSMKEVAAELDQVRRAKKISGTLLFPANMVIDLDAKDDETMSETRQLQFLLHLETYNKGSLFASSSA